MKNIKFLIVVFISLVFFMISCTDEAGTEEKDEGTPAPNSGLWPKRLGNTEQDIGYGIKTDSAGNVYVTGYVMNQADFNGDGIYSDTGGEISGWMEYADIFISKYNSSGAYLWSLRLGGAGGDHGKDLAIDSSNSMIITGEVGGNVDLNGDKDSTDGGAESSSGFGDDDIFVTKFNAGGAYQWSWRLGGSIEDWGWGITADPFNNIYIIGTINGSAKMKGDVTDDQIDLPAALGSYDIIVVKFNSSGEYQWSRRLGGASMDGGYGIAADSDSNVIITGNVIGDADLNGDGDDTDEGEQAYSSFGYDECFMVKFDTAGSCLWSKRLGTIANGSSTGNSVAVNPGGSIYLTGGVTGNVDLNGDGDYNDGGAESTAGYDRADIFIAKYNSSGIYQWSKRLGGDYNDIGRSIAVDPAGNAFITGYVVYNADLNGDGDSIDGDYEFLGRNNGDDIFITKFNTSGEYQWSKRFSGFSDECGYSVTADNTGNAYITGYTRGDTDLNGDGDINDTAESSAGYGENDIFIIKIPN